MIAQQVGIAYLGCFATQVDLAENVKNAITWVISYRYDMIVLDIGLPDGDGKEVAQEIRNNESSRNQETPVIAVTAHGDRERETCFRVGIDRVYSKPLTREMVFCMVKDFGLLINGTLH